AREELKDAEEPLCVSLEIDEKPEETPPTTTSAGLVVRTGIPPFTPFAPMKSGGSAPRKQSATPEIQEAKPPAEELPQTTTTKKKPQILLVDDCLPIVKMLKLMLEKNGYQSRK